MDIKEMDMNGLTIEGKPPAGGVQPTNKQPMMVEVEMGGKKFMVSKEVADTMESEKRRLRDEYEAKISESRKATPKDPPPDGGKAEKKTVKIGDRIFSDPDGAIQEVVETIKNEMREEYQTDRQREKQEAAQARALKEFFDDFYRKNKELKDDKDLVDMIFRANYERWSHLTPDEAQERLAEKSRETILRHTKADLTQDRGLVLESGGSSTSSVPAKKQVKSSDDDGDDDGKPRSLADVVKRRQRARRESSGLKTPGT